MKNYVFILTLFVLQSKTLLFFGWLNPGLWNFNLCQKSPFLEEIEIEYTCDEEETLTPLDLPLCKFIPISFSKIFNSPFWRSIWNNYYGWVHAYWWSLSKPSFSIYIFATQVYFSPLTNSDLLNRYTDQITQIQHNLLEFRAEDPNTGTEPLKLQVGGEDLNGWMTVIDETIVNLNFTWMLNF